MLFNSIQFIIFFIVVTITFFALPHRFRWFLLLASSCYFYMAFVPIYILILFFTILIDYYAGILIENSAIKNKKFFLIASLIANIGVLVIFKYFNFINENITVLLSNFAINNPVPLLKILLPIGLSFHTFQAMSYTIEVYRGNQKAERHFGIYSLYVMFYPQLVAGPIERPQNILHQFHEIKFYNYERVVNGLRLMAWGFFKKIIVADRLALVVDMVYLNTEKCSSIEVFIGVIFFSFQIYCDFSAYSDIALGAAKVMGYDLMINFNNPFISKNVTEFWRRWHISLSTWFNDYLFTPFIIARRELGDWAIVLGLLLTFFLSGLWHGAGWTFIIYGLLHGFITVFEFLTKKNRKKISKLIPSLIYDNLSILLTFLFVSFSWIFFRSENLNKVEFILSKLYDFNINEFRFSILNWHNIILSVIGCLAIQIFDNNSKIMEKFTNLNIYVRWFVYYFLLILIWKYGVFDEKQFIYFQF